MENAEDNVFWSFASFMEQDIRGVELLTYGVASIGFLTAMYRVKPFAKFVKPSDVPQRFIQRKVQLQGTVKRIESSNGVLVMINHKPLVPLPRFGEQKELPVKIAGVTVTGNGVSWLQSVAAGKKVTFLPVSKEKDYVNCIISMMQNEKQSIDLGEELARLGFGIIGDVPTSRTKDNHLSSYWKSLVTAQKYAIRNRNGHWQLVTKPTVFWKLQKRLNDKLKSLLPTYISRQLNI